MELFPPMPLASWQDIKQTLHRFCQIVGIRLAAAPAATTWWNVPFHLTGQGITTRPMGQVDGDPIVTIDLAPSTTTSSTSPLRRPGGSGPTSTGQSVASFHDQDLQALAELDQGGHRPPLPLDHPDAHRPFADDTENASYDRAEPAGTAGPQPGQPGPGRFGPVLRQGEPGAPLLAHLRHRPTPVSDRHVDQPQTAIPVTGRRLGEVINWPSWRPPVAGDPATPRGRPATQPACFSHAWQPGSHCAHTMLAAAAPAAADPRAPSGTVRLLARGESARPVLGQQLAGGVWLPLLIRASTPQTAFVV